MRKYRRCDMALGPTSVVVDEDDRSAALESLALLGFVFEPAVDTLVTMLDTFDGRLHRAGLRLTLLDADGLQLQLAAPGLLAELSPVRTRPRLAVDLPTEQFRSTIAAAIGVRPLLSHVRFRALRSRAAFVDDDGQQLAEVIHFERITVVDAGIAHHWPEEASIVQVRGLAGSPKPARRAVKALARLALDPINGDAIDVIARGVGVALDDFARPASVALDADASALSGVRDVLAHLATSIEANWQGTIDDSDPDFLHDLRVAVRRTRSTITQTKTVLPPDVVGDAGTWFTWLSNLTGPARDLDVYLLEWHDYARPLGTDAVEALEPARTLLASRQTAAHEALSLALAAPRAEAMRASWPQTLAAISVHRPQGANARHTLGSVVRQRIVRAQATLIEKGRLIQPDTPAEQVHDLRKDAKRLRYLLECFASILADGPRRKFVKRLKALQDNLGTHQDAEVHVALLREIAGELGEHTTPAETVVALEQLTERLERIRLDAREKFAERFATYDTDATALAFDDMLDGLGA